MKKVLFALGLYLTLPVLADQGYDSWVSDIKVNNGHVTYTMNVYLPGDNDDLHIKNRRDYICSQNTEAVLWGEATYLSSGKTIDYTSFMDKTKLRKYAPISKLDYDIIRQITPYCKK